MKNIKASDLEIIKVKEEEWKPKFLGMKKKDIFKIEYYSNCIYGYNKDGNEVYYEDSDGSWWKSEYKDGNEVYREYSDGSWWKSEYKDGKKVYYENSNGYWWKSEYKDGNEVYYEYSNGSWLKLDNEGNKIEYLNKKYYLNGKEAKLKK